MFTLKSSFFIYFNKVKWKKKKTHTLKYGTPDLVSKFY